jgi:hypothetical protein
LLSLGPSDPLIANTRTPQHQHHVLVVDNHLTETVGPRLGHRVFGRKQHP